MNVIQGLNDNTPDFIREMFGKFGLVDADINLIKYEALWPDRFMWVFASDIGRYCLYSEDYVPSLEYVLETMNKYGVPTDESYKYTLTEVEEPVEWAESSPVKGAAVYEPPQDTDEFMKYAVPHGSDFVFLGH